MFALLPMKANSERVSNKNFRLIAGKPLYVWILENLFKLDFLEKIIINTDANFELFDQFKNNNKLILRSRLEHLRGDHVSMNLIIEDDLKHFAKILIKSGLELQSLEIIYSDTFFDFNIKNIEKKNTLILIIIHNQTNQFLQQIEIHGESMMFGNHPHIDCVNFNFKQRTNNKVWKSIPNDFSRAEEVYKSERLSYIRESRINKILD